MVSVLWFRDLDRSSGECPVCMSSSVRARASAGAPSLVVACLLVISTGPLVDPSLSLANMGGCVGRVGDSGGHVDALLVGDFFGEGGGLLFRTTGGGTEGPAAVVDMIDVGCTDAARVWICF